MQTDLEIFEGRRQHAWNKINWHVPAEVRRGRFIDLGCGSGNGVIAAIQNGFSMAIGIDANLNEFYWFRSSEFDQICEYYNVEASRALLLEGDVNNVGFLPRSFDTVFLLDSIEHIPDPTALIHAAAKILSPGGVLLIDTCPLFYSKVGHHFFDYFSAETHPWVHLRLDFPDLLRDSQVNEWHIQRFNELNRVTHQQLRDAVLAAELIIIEEHPGTPAAGDRELLDTLRPRLDLRGVDERALLEDWTLLVAIRPRSMNQFLKNADQPLRKVREAGSWDGAVIVASGPRGPDQPALRRAQALVCSGVMPTAAVAIAREILRVKLRGQADVARFMGSTDASAAIGSLAEAIAGETDGRKALSVEAALH